MANLEKEKNYAVENIEKMQNKAIRFLNFKRPRGGASDLYKESKIYTLKHITTIENCRFVYDQIKKNFLNNFSNYFTVKKNQHQYNRRRKNLDFPVANLNGSNSITMDLTQ